MSLSDPRSLLRKCLILTPRDPALTSTIQTPGGGDDDPDPRISPPILPALYQHDLCGSCLENKLFKPLGKVSKISPP